MHPKQIQIRIVAGVFLGNFFRMLASFRLGVRIGIPQDETQNTVTFLKHTGLTVRQS